jgi:hypothetical protein
MKLKTQQRLRMFGGACLLTLSSAFAMPAVPSVAQTPVIPGTSLPAPAAPLPKPMFSKSATFNLPIQMEEVTRQNLQKVQLWVKAPGASWCKQDEVKPSSQQFSYKALQDGEYWFNLVTVDKLGRATPANVTLEPPGLRVIVDTKPPVIDVHLLPSSNGDCGLFCTIQDANADPSSMRVLGRGAAGDVPLEALPGQPGVFRVRPEVMGHFIRISASDLAGNATVRDVNLKDLYAAAGKPFPGAALPPALAGHPAAPVPLLPEPTPSPGLAAPAMLTPVAGIEKPLAPAQVGATLPPPVPSTDPKMPMLPLDVSPTVSKTGPANRRLIATTRACIDYRIDQTGPSGVGRVEIYITHDQGATWRRAGEDADRQSPAEVDLPGEGLFGIRLAITNGNGFGGTPPARGDAPHCWVEVDTTPPFVQLRPTEIVAQGGALDIRWTASDPNLAVEPVALFFRTRADAPWQLIARGLKNDGVHRWVFPRDAGSQFLFKIEVADMAGNVARAESPAPVVLDMTEPRASVVGITGMGKAPSGN